jgi:ribose transport system substrate-binding protein
MGPIHSWHSRAATRALATAAAVALVVSACSSSTATPTAAPATTVIGTQAPASAAGTGADLAYVQAQIAKYSAIPTFVAPGAAIDISTLKGKTIFNVPQTSSIPFLETTIQSMGTIVKSIGLNWVDYPTTGQPSQWVQGISQAINTKADAIALNVVDPRLVGPQIDQAKAAGIPSVSLQFYDVSQVSQAPANVAAVRADNFGPAARLEADWTISDTNGNADVLVVGNNEVLSSVAMIDAIKDEFATRCPACKVTYLNVPATDWATKVQPDVASALVQDPNINYIIPIYDALTQFVAPAITAGGMEGKVHLSTFNGTPFALDMIRTGDIVTMDIGEDLDWLAYANIDELSRAMLGQPGLASENNALRVFTKANVSEAGNPATFNLGFGNSYVTGYKQLWGVAP